MMKIKKTLEVFKLKMQHRHKKRKGNLETRAVLLIFLFELELGVSIQWIHQNSKKCGSPEDRYRSKRLSQMFLMCYTFLNCQIYQPITEKNDWLLKHLQKLLRKSSNNWPMVSFFHTESEITWMGYSFKTKSTKSKATFSR